MSCGETSGSRETRVSSLHDVLLAGHRAYVSFQSSPLATRGLGIGIRLSSVFRVTSIRNTNHELFLEDAFRRSVRVNPEQQKVVFGFLPYWIDAGYYQHIDYELLTHIAAFSVEVNSDGSLGNDHGWPWTALVDEAHRHGVRVILTATW